MINFIICEDNENVREIDEQIISKAAMPYDFDYRVYSFEKYCLKLKNIINTPSDMNIYLLDIELPGKSGIEIAREIRKVDWDSVIIILTSHNELELKMFKEKLLIFDFVSKFDNYEEKLKENLKVIINKIGARKILSFKCNREIYHLKFDNILYICRDTELLKTKIVTDDNEYLVRESISSLVKRLDNRFYRSHRSCYVNKDNIKKVDPINRVIYFNGGKSTDYLSREYKKGLR